MRNLGAQAEQYNKVLAMQSKQIHTGPFNSALKHQAKSQQRIQAAQLDLDDSIRYQYGADSAGLNDLSFDDIDVNNKRY